MATMSETTAGAHAAHLRAAERHQAALAALIEAEAAVAGIPERRAALRRQVAGSTGNERLDAMADLVSIEERELALATPDPASGRPGAARALPVARSVPADD